MEDLKLAIKKKNLNWQDKNWMIKTLVDWENKWRFYNKISTKIMTEKKKEIV